MASIELNQYFFECPLLVFADRLATLKEEEWYTPDAWVDALEKQSHLLGIVLPLELKTDNKKRQELLGMDLLEWLRWSAGWTGSSPPPPGARCYVPVLAIAWQPIEQVLRKKPDLLLIAQGTAFARLPEAAADDHSVVRRFLESVRKGDSTLQAKETDLTLMTLKTIRSTSSHELANDGYAASRLWAGYLSALRSADKGGTLQGELERARKVKFDSLKDLPKKMRTPAFHQFQLAKRTPEVPSYPAIENADRIVQWHVSEGLPENTRILLVDDEFDKGLDDVVQNILFAGAHFDRRQNPDKDEEIFTAARPGGQWARMVCVKDVQRAACWLKYWNYGKKKMDLEKVIKSQNTYDDWLSQWCQVVNKDPSDKVLGWLDDPHVWPKRITTIMLLDLRLSKSPKQEIYKTESMDSVYLRRLIKAKDADFPVIFLTASRQALNYAVAMAEASEVDGWLTKEAPDVPADDDNSRNAVHYLLERIHLFASLRDWHRNSLAWDRDQKLNYVRLWNSPHRHQCLAYVEDRSNYIWGLMLTHAGWWEIFYAAQTFWSIIQLEVPCCHFPIEQHLVARRLVVAALLKTATWKSGQPSWNYQLFLSMLPGRKKGKWKPGDHGKAPYDKVNFNEDLYMNGSDPSILKGLLEEEYGWLDRITWPSKLKPLITKCLATSRKG